MASFSQQIKERLDNFGVGFSDFSSPAGNRVQFKTDASEGTVRVAVGGHTVTTKDGLVTVTKSK